MPTPRRMYSLLGPESPEVTQATDTMGCGTKLDTLSDSALPLGWPHSFLLSEAVEHSG